MLARVSSAGMLEPAFLLAFLITFEMLTGGKNEALFRGIVDWARQKPFYKCSLEKNADEKGSRKRVKKVK